MMRGSARGEGRDGALRMIFLMGRDGHGFRALKDSEVYIYQAV
jgi:hypothetical protein